MPELPDVEVFRRYLESTALHQMIESVHAPAPRLLDGTSAAGLGRMLKGLEFERTERIGKHLLVRVDEGKWVRFHFGMTGSFDYSTDGSTPDYAAVVFEFENGHSLSYLSKRRLGKVSVTEGPEAFHEEEDLGPDALDGIDDPKAFAGMIQGRRGAIKSTLMNQSVVSGIGNIYADEIFFQAQVHPKTAIDDLSEDSLAYIYRVAKRVLQTAIDKGAQPGEFPRSWLIARREEDASCPRCDGEVAKTTVNGRSTYYCSSCQRK